MDTLGMVADRPEMKLMSVIGLYAGRGMAVASVQPVTANRETGEAEASEGYALTREGIESLVRFASGTREPGYGREVFPANLLCYEYGLTCWWTQAQRRAIFFDTGDKAFDEEMNGQDVLHPPLVFVGKPHALIVYALGESARPDGDAQLLRAPYYNLYGHGAMCEGNVPLPALATPEAIHSYERAFFDSSFVHTNMVGQTLTLHPQGHLGLWKEMRTTESSEFPFEYLAPVEQAGEPMTLRKAINL